MSENRVAAVSIVVENKAVLGLEHSGTGWRRRRAGGL